MERVKHFKKNILRKMMDSRESWWIYEFLKFNFGRNSFYVDKVPSPYHGYYYKILKAQGKNAPGGEYDYMVKGKMIGGFALVAYPAEYGNSGIMTFIVNHDGVVYEKDLGKDTEKIATAMKKFDLNRIWKKVE